MAHTAAALTELIVGVPALTAADPEWGTRASPHLTAELIPAAPFPMMSGQGHFPTSEDPQQFLSYRRPALDTIAAGSTTQIAS